MSTPTAGRARMPGSRGDRERGVLRVTARKLAQTIMSRIPRSGRHRDVLLACHNAMTASHLRDFQDVFRGDGRLRFWFCRRRREEGDRLAISTLLPFPEVGSTWANVRPWDLVVLADHGFSSLCTPGRHPVLRIPHGIGGKMVDGEDYQYSPHLIQDERGHLRYTCMFESSESRKRMAVARDPRLEGVIEVVGCLVLDRLRMQAADPTQGSRVRTEGGRKRVLVCSSWGSESLLPRCGDAMLEEILRLSDRFEFFVRPHPNLLEADGGNGWRARLAAWGERGIGISWPGEDMTEALAASDIVVGDDLTTMSLYAAALGKPLVLMRSRSAAIPSESFAMRLAAVIPVCSSPQELAGILPGLHERWPPAGLDAIARELACFPGQSGERIRAAVYRLLRLRPLDGG